MRRRKLFKRDILLVLAILFVPSLSRALSTEELFRAGAEKYLKRDLRGAVRDWREAWAQEPGDNRVKEALVNTLIILGKKSLQRGDMKVASSYFTYAGRLAPETEGIRALLLLAEMEEQFPNGGGFSSGELKTEAEEGTIMAIILKMGIGERVEERERRVIVRNESLLDRKLLNQLMSQQENLTKLYSTLQNTMEKMNRRFEEEREDYIRIIEGQNTQQTDFSQRYFIGLGVLLVITALFIFFGFGLIGRKIQHIAAQMGIAQKRKPLKREGLQTIEESVGELLGNSNPWIRAKGVELLGKELISSTQPGVARNLLDSFLKDKNHLVRATAAKVLYSIDPNYTIQFLDQMMSDDDPWMRVSGARVLGQIGTPEAAGILIKHLIDGDYNVKRMMLSSLKKIMDFDSRKYSYTPEVVEDIKKAVQSIQLSEGWVV